VVKQQFGHYAWRHTFKQIADRVGISERMSDYITGHAHRTIGCEVWCAHGRAHGGGAGEVSAIRSRIENPLLEPQRALVRPF
jgi:hypothetical protein